MAAKKRTSKKGNSSPTARRGGKRPAKKKASKKTSEKKGSRRKPRQTVRAPGPYAQLAGAPYGWGRIGAGARKVATQHWKRRVVAPAPAPKLLPAATVEAMNAQGGSHPLVQAYARAGGTPPGYVRSGPYVGPARPWPKKTKKKADKLVGAPGGGYGKKAKKASKKKAKKASKKPTLSPSEFLQKMDEGRAAATARRKGKKHSKKAKRHAKKAAPAAVAAPKTASKSAKKHSKKASRKASPARVHAAKKRAHAPATAKKRSTSRRRGWPKAGKNRRTFGIAKFQAMNKFGVPPNHPIAREKVAALRQAAGRGISARDVFKMAKATQMKAWVCAGRVRTGCGGGSKMLRGSHQIGVFGVGRR